jgi:hypothetical protein
MEYGLEYLGRRIDASILKFPSGLPAIMIDVYQMEGDCPKGLELEDRLKCERDCQNTYLSFWLNIINLEVIGMGMLARNNDSYLLENITKAGLSPKDIPHLLKTEPGNFEQVDREDSKVLLYKGLPVIARYDCVFSVGKYIQTEDSNFKPYIDLIEGNKPQILSQCGIEIAENIVINHRRNRESLEFMRPGSNLTH